MDYMKIYNSLIQKRLDNPITKEYCYCETHHILPRCMGGSNSTNNLVNLTGREHYLAHACLWKYAKEHDRKHYPSLLYAFSMMNCKAPKKHQDNRAVFNARLYESMRKEVGKVLAANRKSPRWTPEIQKKREATIIKRYGTMKHSEATKRKQSEGLKRYYETVSDHKCRRSNEANKIHAQKMTGRKWMHIPGTKTAVFVNEADMQSYLKLGYILGRYFSHKTYKN